MLLQVELMGDGMEWTVDGLMKLLQFKRDMGQICTKSVAKGDFSFILHACHEYDGFAKGYTY